MILAQINDHRNQLRQKANPDSKRIRDALSDEQGHIQSQSQSQSHQWNQPEREGTGIITNSPLRNANGNANANIMVDINGNENENDNKGQAGTNNVNDGRTKSKSISKSKRTHLKRIRLTKNDEIHVAPCQCALRLVGMKERKPTIDSKDEKTGNSNGIGAVGFGKISNEDDFGSIFGRHFLGGMENTNARRAHTGTGSLSRHRHVRTASVMIAEEDQKRISDQSIPPLNSSLVRTISAQASSTVPALKKKGSNYGSSSGAGTRNPTVTFSNTVSSNKEKSSSQTSYSRSESNLFTSLGYHEITLICNPNRDRDNEASKCEQKTEDGEDLLPWDAVTMRCSSHDELDDLVKSLKDSSQAKVVPFSSNPKERLKKLRAERMRKDRARLKRKAKVIRPGNAVSVSNRNDRNSRTAPSLASFIGANRVPENNADKGSNHRVPKPQDEKDGALLTKAPGKGKGESKKIKEKRKPWDLNFNKKEYCEVCDLTFTLLTRRHHCRKCDLSCCGHCSQLLIVKGCDEKRYCNRCASIILQKQSEALQGRLRKKSKETMLPGKVNEACMRLGVGVVGRLPHWKTFLRPNLEDRPAVGRLTVELIEAIALPSVDMVNGKVDPYVRATITGYDRDMTWTLRHWLKKNRYSLCSRFCAATLSPQWRGSGRKGGELLTLPVISTAGAVLRLEVLHYNVLTNSRGKDAVLGAVEIPLSDLPNANLRHPGGVEVETSDGRRKSLTFDGYCDRWYRLIPADEIDSNSIVLSKPIGSSDLKMPKGGGNRKVGMQSLEEVGKRAQAIAIAPIEWIASAIKLDLPAKRPEAICQEHKARSMIHVRIKMNASVFGDIVSHAWFPPVRPSPIPPSYDPEILLSRILRVGKLTAAYRRIIKYIELCIKWKHEPIVCVKAYLIFAFHLALFPRLLPLLHIYLFLFLAKQSFEMKMEDDIDVLQASLHCPDSMDLDTDNGHKPIEEQVKNDSSTEALSQLPPTTDEKSNKVINNDAGEYTQVDFHSSPSLKELSHQRQRNKKLDGSIIKTGLDSSISNESLVNATDKNAISPSNVTTEEEVTKLNIAIHWIALRFGENKGLEVLQFKLGNLGRGLQNLNSVWDGSNPILTRAAMVYLMVSFVLHFVMSQRLLWLIGTATFYFSRSPFVILTARFMFGFWRGIAKATRRQQLLDAEILSTIS